MTVAANPTIKHCHAPLGFRSFVIWQIAIWRIKAAPIFFLQAKQEPKFCGPLTFFFQFLIFISKIYFLTFFKCFPGTNVFKFFHW
jgi:hypothetical protein